MFNEDVISENLNEKSFNLNEKYTLGYSYGMPTSDVSSYNSGSHEFMLAIKILD